MMMRTLIADPLTGKYIDKEIREVLVWYRNPGILLYY